MNDWHLLRCYACVHSVFISFACAIWRLVIVHDTCPCCKLISKNISTLAFKCSLGNVVLMRFWYLSQTEAASTPATDCWSAGRYYQFVCACVYVYFCIFISERAVAVHPLATRGCTVDAENAFFLNDEVVAGIFPFSSIFFFFLPSGKHLFYYNSCVWRSTFSQFKILKFTEIELSSICY